MKAIALALASALLFAPIAMAAPGAGGGLSSIPTGPKGDPAKAFQDGFAALQGQDYKTAEKKFGDVLSAAPDNPEANYYMGLSKLHLGKEKQSVRYFKRAIGARANFVEAREQLALASVKLGDKEEAAKQLAAVKDLQATCTPETCDQPYMDRLARAVARIEAAVNEPPAPVGGQSAPVEEDQQSAAAGSNDRFSYLLLDRASGVDLYRDAVHAINEGRYGAAIDLLHEAQAVIGPHPDILNYLGYAQRKLGKFEEAKTYYRQALALAPDHRGANEYLGELYLELGDIEKAKRQLAKLEAICAFECVEREDLARQIAIKESVRNATKE